MLTYEQLQKMQNTLSIMPREAPITLISFYDTNEVVGELTFSTTLHSNTNTYEQSWMISILTGSISQLNITSSEDIQINNYQIYFKSTETLVKFIQDNSPCYIHTKEESEKYNVLDTTNQKSFN